MAPDSVPLVIGSTEQFRDLRSALVDLDFDEASICRRAGIPSMFDFKTKSDGRQIGTDLHDALDALIRLLMDSETIPLDRLQSLVPAAHIAALEALGVLAEAPEKPDWRQATVHLYPIESLYVASDRRDDNMPWDAVYPPINGNTQRFLGTLPPWPCESLLDLCSGTGIAALIAAAKYANHAWSCDVGQRCVRFADFNRRLNGIENAICAQGDLYQAVGDLTFDRIVAHPPFVPADERKILYRDGGEDGEQVLRGLIQGLPRHLRRGGRCYAMTMATDREGSSFEQRIRGWLGEKEREFDVMLVAYSMQSPPAFLQYLKEQSQGRLAFGPSKELLDGLKVTAVYYGAVVIERLANARPAVTMRTHKAPGAGWEALDWFVRWSTAAAAPEFDDFLLRSRPHPAPHLELTIAHRVQDRTLVPSRFELKSEFPFSVAAACPPYLAILVGACNGRKTLLEIYEEMKRTDAIEPETTAPQFLGDIRSLISYGLLELDEFPLPEPRTRA